MWTFSCALRNNYVGCRRALSRKCRQWSCGSLKLYGCAWKADVYVLYISQCIGEVYVVHALTLLSGMPVRPPRRLATRGKRQSERERVEAASTYSFQCIIVKLVTQARRKGWGLSSRPAPSLSHTRPTAGYLLSYAPMLQSNARIITR